MEAEVVSPIAGGPPGRIAHEAVGPESFFDS